MKTLINKLCWLYTTTFDWISAILAPILLLLIRLNWGWQLFLSGKGKLLHHERTTDFFTELGIPMPGLNAWFVAGVEAVGGLLLLVGLFSRPAAAIIAINMLVAYISVSEDRAALFGAFTDPDTFVEASPFFFLLMALLVLAFGPGKLSLDALIGKKIRRLFCGQ